MDARLARAAVLAAALASLGASYRTQNFVVTAPTQQMAEQIGKQAETFRRDLAILWLGKPLPNWRQPCPIEAQIADHLGAGGATSFMFDAGEVFGWTMSIQGSLERVLDSVLPHEVTHTIFASHFRRPLPRWADEGACTTVEHTSERTKQQQMLIQFLRTNRGIPFHTMFALKEYPADVLPLYAQGHSLASFLIQQGGRQKFLNFVGAGLQAEQWPSVTKQFYGFDNLAELQNNWLAWVRKGSPKLQQPEPGPAPAGDTLLASAGGKRKRPEPNLIVRGQSGDDAPAPQATAAAPHDLVPVSRPNGAIAQGPAGARPPVPTARELAMAANAPAAINPGLPGPGSMGGAPPASPRDWPGGHAAPGANNAVTSAAPTGASRGMPGHAWDDRPLDQSLAQGTRPPVVPGGVAQSIYMTRNSEPLAAQ